MFTQPLSLGQLLIVTNTLLNVYCMFRPVLRHITKQTHTIYMYISGFVIIKA